MDQITQLLKPELLAMGAAFVIVFQIIWKVFDWAEILPSLPKWLVPASMVPTAFLLAWREHSIQPPDPSVARVLADDWAIQGAFLLAAMLSAWLTAWAAFSETRRTSATASVMPPAILGAFLLWAFNVSGAQPASAQDSRTGPWGLNGATLADQDSLPNPDVLRWDPKRLAVRVQAFGVLHNFQSDEPVRSSFDVGAAVSWNLSRRLSVSIGADHDFGLELDQLKAGGAGQLAGTGPDDDFHLFIGALWVGYRGSGRAEFEKQNSWQVVIQGAQTLAETKAGRKWLALIVSGRYDPENERAFGYLGLGGLALGGRR